MLLTPFHPAAEAALNKDAVNMITELLSWQNNSSAANPKRNNALKPQPQIVRCLVLIFSIINVEMIFPGIAPN